MQNPPMTNSPQTKSSNKDSPANCKPTASSKKTPTFKTNVPHSNPFKLVSPSSAPANRFPSNLPASSGMSPASSLLMSRTPAPVPPTAKPCPFVTQFRCLNRTPMQKKKPQKLSKPLTTTSKMPVPDSPFYWAQKPH